MLNQGRKISWCLPFTITITRQDNLQFANAKNKMGPRPSLLLLTLLSIKADKNILKHEELFH